MVNSQTHTGIIQILPEHVANQIAAGEVVQRPASAVKELIENAIDSGADKIKVIFSDAGKTLIQIIDNGCGMTPSDTRNAFHRHATSKINKAEDLFAIRTMGFRGEALASIAAVAQVELKSRRIEDEFGIQINIHGSQIVSEEPGAFSQGTSIAVKNLFYNIPARRNFLKSNPVEIRHIIDEFQRQALAHPQIGFILIQDGHEVFHLPQGTLKQRIVHVFGNSYNEKLVPIEEDTSIIKVSGFIGKPNFAKKTRGEQYLFVNNRFIKDPYLNHAIMKAYEGVLPSETFPLFVIFIEIDPSKIDINVHPTKTEIKYEDDKAIYAIMQSSVKRSLGKYHITPTLDFNQETGFENMIKPLDLAEITVPSIQFNPDFNPFDNTETPKTQKNYSSENYHKAFEKNWESLYEIVESAPAKQTILHSELDDNASEIENTVSNKFYQLHNRFIISQIHSGFLLIDQQAAHERILYEKFKSQLEARKGLSQPSLFPQTLTIGIGDVPIFEEILPEICTLGFQIRSLGKNTYVVEAAPADLNVNNQEIAILEEMIEDLKQTQSAPQMNMRDQLAKSLAKSVSIKSGTRLTTEEMLELVDKLFACEMVNVSIYGKPIILTITLQEILSRFEQKN